MDESGVLEEVEARRIAVPGSLFGERPVPPFVLFDRRGRVADLLIARTVYVAPSDAAALDAFLAAGLRRIAGSRRVAAPARAWALHRVLLHEVERALRTLPARGALAGVLPALEVASTLVPGEPGLHLAEVAHAPASPATYGVATALYAMTLAAAEGIDDREALMQIGVAGVFADVAKFQAAEDGDRGRDEPAGRLDAIEAHPQRGAELLLRAGVRARSALDAVRAHHERWDGAGYPEGRSGAAIPLAARILRIADAYAGLTAGTGGLRGYEALLAMAQSEGEFEPRLLRSYVRALGRALNVNARWTPADEREAEGEARAEAAGAA